MSFKRVFILCGEPSGDLHASNLVKALLAQQPNLEITCWGGDKLAAAGATVLKHIDELAFMGFVEVVANLRTILKNFKLCEAHIKNFQPDLVVFVDYPGFNLRMGKKVNALGIETAYYISPQIWAWKENRVQKIKRYIDHVFVILPFEKAFYAKHGVEASFVGHPLLDELNDFKADEVSFRKTHQLEDNRPIISLLPGSRTQEIKNLLKRMASVIDAFPEYQFAVSKVPWQPRELYENHIPKNAKVIEGQTYELLSLSEAAVVTSGTATLETALLNTPQVVVYKGNALSIWIARWLVKINFISLVNLIMDKEVVKELIQEDVNEKALKKELSLILEGGSKRAQLLNDYAELKEKLGSSGASKNVATRLLKILDSEKN